MLHFTSSSEINLQHHIVAIITNQVYKVAKAWHTHLVQIPLPVLQINIPQKH
jgi:hypothetical protein